MADGISSAHLGNFGLAASSSVFLAAFFPFFHNNSVGFVVEPGIETGIRVLLALFGLLLIGIAVVYRFGSPSGHRAISYVSLGLAILALLHLLPVALVMGWGISDVDQTSFVVRHRVLKLTPAAGEIIAILGLLSLTALHIVALRRR
ncbi:hypothetical protein LO762_28490 [Actinocorallia sp. API 0066]|uniref:hypothetical protein n=1 Tax=Actinocorallia sp. API 0066 TaxID=2896846 RepID=UPI001E3A0A8A|nr:hypothetical protein [Actinocorallia sp. API 0066]MCD0453092.1 hypothetical protein [Actinocorallia sp. API 0066]